MKKLLVIGLFLHDTTVTDTRIVGQRKVTDTDFLFLQSVCMDW